MLSNESRQTRVERLLAWVKEDKGVRDNIIALLKEGNKSVPELSIKTGVDSATVFWHIIAMKKYGRVAEAEMRGEYPSYCLVEETK